MCSLADILGDWADSTTCHGVPDVRKSRSCCGKLLWTLITLTFFLIMSIQLFAVYGSFSKHQWLTTVSEESSNEFKEFPTITICSYNRLEQSKRIAKGLTDRNLAYIFGKIPVIQGVVSAIEKYGSNASDAGMDEFLKWKKEHNLSTKQIFETMSPSCSGMIGLLHREDFLTGGCTSSKNANFTSVFTTEFGQCYQITITLTKGIVFGGKTQGLTMLLKANLHEYLNFSMMNYMDEGFAIQLQFGSRVIVGQWLTVAPGFHYMFAMKERVTRTTIPKDLFSMIGLRETFSLFGSKPPCAMKPTLKYDVDEHYSREQCLFECRLGGVFDNCQCLPFVDSPKYRMCEVEELEYCNSLLMEHNATEATEACVKSCEEPCSDRRVETSITFTRFPPRSQLYDLQTIMEYINESLTFEEIREGYVLLDIFFEKLSITVVERYELLGLEDLVSNLGGVMSLWAGMSILTVVQALVYLLHALLCGLCPTRKKKRRSTTQSVSVPPKNRPFSSSSDA